MAKGKKKKKKKLFSFRQKILTYYVNGDCVNSDEAQAALRNDKRLQQYWVEVFECLPEGATSREWQVTLLLSLGTS